MLQSSGWRVTSPCLTVIPSAPALPLRSSHHPSVSCCRASRSVDVKMIWGPSRSWKENHSTRSRHRWHSLLSTCLRSSGVLVFDQTLFSLVTFHRLCFMNVCKRLLFAVAKKSIVISCRHGTICSALIPPPPGHTLASDAFLCPGYVSKKQTLRQCPQHSWNAVVKSAAARSKCSLL